MQNILEATLTITYKILTLATKFTKNKIKKEKKY
jgi:hypothetical protein